MKKKSILTFLLALATTAAVGVTACDNGNNDDNKEPAHEHAYATEWSHDETNHWHAATCEHTTEKSGNAAHDTNGTDGACSVCGFKHEHTYATEWSHDATNHWHVANCEHTDEKSDNAAHSDVKNNATDTDGADGKCDVCGAILSADAEALAVFAGTYFPKVEHLGDSMTDLEKTVVSVTVDDAGNGSIEFKDKTVNYTFGEDVYYDVTAKSLVFGDYKLTLVYNELDEDDEEGTTPSLKWLEVSSADGEDVLHCIKLTGYTYEFSDDYYWTEYSLNLNLDKTEGVYSIMGMVSNSGNYEVTLTESEGTYSFTYTGRLYDSEAGEFVSQECTVTLTFDEDGNVVLTDEASNLDEAVFTFKSPVVSGVVFAGTLVRDAGTDWENADDYEFLLYPDLSGGVLTVGMDSYVFVITAGDEENTYNFVSGDDPDAWDYMEGSFTFDGTEVVFDDELLGSGTLTLA